MQKALSIIILCVAGYFGYQYYNTHIAVASNIEDKSLIWAWSLSGALNEENNVNHFIYGGETSDAYKSDYVQALTDWWDISSKEQALKTIDDLSKGQGHHAAFMEQYESLLNAPQEKWDEAAKTNNFIKTLAEHKDTINDHGLLAWDYSRAQWIIGMAYKAGYFSSEEARNFAIPLAVKTQAVFASWEEMADNYALGLYYWTEDAPEYYKIKATNTKLLSSKNSPWQILDWNLPLLETQQAQKPQE